MVSSKRYAVTIEDIMKPHTEAVRKDLVVSKNRPFTLKPRLGTNSTLHPDVKEWLKEMVQNHWYLYECKQTGSLRIAFHDHNDAMRFKLAWH